MQSRSPRRVKGYQPIESSLLSFGPGVTLVTGPSYGGVPTSYRAGYSAIMNPVASKQHDHDDAKGFVSSIHHEGCLKVAQRRKRHTDPYSVCGIKNRIVDILIPAWLSKQDLHPAGEIILSSDVSNPRKNRKRQQIDSDRFAEMLGASIAPQTKTAIATMSNLIHSITTVDAATALAVAASTEVLNFTDESNQEGTLSTPPSINDHDQRSNYRLDLYFVRVRAGVDLEVGEEIPEIDLSSVPLERAVGYMSPVDIYPPGEEALRPTAINHVKTNLQELEGPDQTTEGGSSSSPVVFADAGVPLDHRVPVEHPHSCVLMVRRKNPLKMLASCLGCGSLKAKGLSVALCCPRITKQSLMAVRVRLESRNRLAGRVGVFWLRRIWGSAQVNEQGHLAGAGRGA